MRRRLLHHRASGVPILYPVGRQQWRMKGKEK
jgi:hypothetical protein